jgi:hypothetical protein
MPQFKYRLEHEGNGPYVPKPEYQVCDLILINGTTVNGQLRGHVARIVKCELVPDCGDRYIWNEHEGHVTFDTVLTKMSYLVTDPDNPDNCINVPYQYGIKYTAEIVWVDQDLQLQHTHDSIRVGSKIVYEPGYEKDIVKISSAS